MTRHRKGLGRRKDREPGKPTQTAHSGHEGNRPGNTRAK